MIDASHPEALEQVKAVQLVLAELDVDPARIIGVLNKADAGVDPVQLSLLRAELGQSVLVSAVTGAGLDQLADLVVARRSADWRELWLQVPHAEGRVHALVREHGEILTEAWDEAGWRARVSVPVGVVWQLERFAAPEAPVAPAPATA